MEYVSEGNLGQILDQYESLEEGSARMIAAELMLAMEYIHEQGILFRDLKPDNILLHRDGHIRLTDFGLSKRTSSAASSFCGSPAYLAPEMLQRAGVTGSSDVY